MTDPSDKLARLVDEAADVALDMIPGRRLIKRLANAYYGEPDVEVKQAVAAEMEEEKRAALLELAARQYDPRVGDRAFRAWVFRIVSELREHELAAETVDAESAYLLAASLHELTRAQSLLVFGREAQPGYHDQGLGRRYTLTKVGLRVWALLKEGAQAEQTE